MPFAGYRDFEECVKANQDKRDPTAYCAAIEREYDRRKAAKERHDRRPKPIRRSGRFTW
jgi:hypothetical protein